MISGLEADSSLFEPDQIWKRLEVLDRLDKYFAECRLAPYPPIYQRAKEIRIKLEAVNSDIYQSIRNDLRAGSSQQELLRWIQLCRAHENNPPHGLRYDQLDELISGVFQLREPAMAEEHRKPERVFYQPTPARHILEFTRASRLSKDDILFDLGSGLGHVTLLASILTGTRSIGVEANSAYVKSARSCALALGLDRVTFVRQDATKANLSAGTIFYMYTPFTGTLLKNMLRNLRRESDKRRIKICTLGPCTLVVAREPWLKGINFPDCDRITCFHSSP